MKKHEVVNTLHLSDIWPTSLFDKQMKIYTYLAPTQKGCLAPPGVCVHPTLKVTALQTDQLHTMLLGKYRKFYVLTCPLTKRLPQSDTNKLNTPT